MTLSACLISFISLGCTNLKEKSDKLKPSCVFTSNMMDDNVPNMFPIHLFTQTSDN